MLRAEVTRCCLDFVRAAQQLVDENSDQIRGSSTVWRVTGDGIQQFVFILNGASLLTMPVEQKQKVLASIGELRNFAKDIGEYLGFLGSISAANRRAGVRVFKSAFREDIDEVIEGYQAELTTLHNILDFQMPSDEAADFEASCRRLAAGLKSLKATAEQYYA